MSDAKKTPWLPGKVRPVRGGVYERKLGPDNTHIVFGRWTGGRWMFSEPTPEYAARAQHPSAYDNVPWRGLAQTPKERK